MDPKTRDYVLIAVYFVAIVVIWSIGLNAQDLTTDDQILADEIQQAQMELGECVDTRLWVDTTADLMVSTTYMPTTSIVLAEAGLTLSWADGVLDVQIADGQKMTDAAREFIAALKYFGVYCTCNTDATYPDNCDKSPQTRSP